MAGIGNFLGNAAAIYNGADNSFYAQQQHKQQQDDNNLRQMLMRQNMQQQQQEWQLKQQELARGNNAARAAVGALGGAGASPGGIPQPVQVPGAQPIPGMSQPGGMNMGPQGMAPMSPPPAMSRSTQLPAQGGGVPRSPQQPQMGAQGGGLPLDQLADRIRQQLPPDQQDPLTIYDAMSKYQTMMKPQDADEFKRIGLMIQEMRLENQTKTANAKSGEPSTARREMDNRAYGLGIDPMGMDDKALSKALAAKSGAELGAKDAKRDKPTTPQWRYEVASNDVKSTADNIKAIIKAHPNAVGAYGKLYKGMGGIAGFLHEPEPADAEAANALDVQIKKLDQSLGVAGSLGGMGSSSFAKDWESTISGKDWITNPQKLNDVLDSVTGNVERFKVPAGATQDADIDALIGKYNQPGQ